jgi:hypothetical protein
LGDVTDGELCAAWKPLLSHHTGDKVVQINHSSISSSATHGSTTNTINIKTIATTNPNRNPTPASSSTTYSTNVVSDASGGYSSSTMHWMGRQDRQLKRSGHRLHPDMIAATIEKWIPDVNQCVVLVVDPHLHHLHDHPNHQQQSSQEPVLVAACVMAEATAAAEAPTKEHLSLHGAMRQCLPPAAVPDHIVHLESLPCTHSGKIDLRALAKLAMPMVASQLKQQQHDDDQHYQHQHHHQQLGHRTKGGAPEQTSAGNTLDALWQYVQKASTHQGVVLPPLPVTAPQLQTVHYMDVGGDSQSALQLASALAQHCIARMEASDQGVATARVRMEDADQGVATARVRMEAAGAATARVRMEAAGQGAATTLFSTSVDEVHPVLLVALLGASMHAVVGIMAHIIAGTSSLNTATATALVKEQSPVTPYTALSLVAKGGWLLEREEHRATIPYTADTRAKSKRQKLDDTPPHTNDGGTVLYFRQDFALEEAVRSHSFSLEANMHVPNSIPLGCQLPLTFTTIQIAWKHERCRPTPCM